MTIQSIPLVFTAGVATVNNTGNLDGTGATAFAGLIDLSYSFQGAGSGTVSIDISRSMDGTNYETALYNHVFTHADSAAAHRLILDTTDFQLDVDSFVFPLNRLTPYFQITVSSTYPLANLAATFYPIRRHEAFARSIL